MGTAVLETVHVERRGAAAIVTMNRPDALNAFNRQLTTELRAALLDAQRDPEVRAVVLTGAGRAFSSGADLKDMSGREDELYHDRPDLYRALNEQYHPITEALRLMPKPTLAAVNGPAVGVGLAFALACDLVVAHESAYFLLAFVNIGLVPDGGASALVAARVGMTRASEMAMLGEKVPAATALDWGLVNRVHDDASFRTEVEALTDRLAAGPTQSYAGSKRQVNHWLFQGLAEQLELESRLQRDMALTSDFVEGVGAFLQKRPAEFTGR